LHKKLGGIGTWLVSFAILMAVYSMIGSFMNTKTPTQYSDFISAIKKEQVHSILIDEKTALYTLTDEVTPHGDYPVYTTQIPSAEVLREDVGEEILSQIENNNLQYNIKKKGISIGAILTPLISIVLLIFFFVMIVRQSPGGKNGGFTRIHAKLTVDDKNKTGFANVAGAVEEKAELEELVEFLKNPKKFISLGARIPKGVLLVGSPGTGKTLLARAVAGEAGVPFFSISGSDFVELYVGVGASRVRDLFEQAKKNRPCIVFIDEIDAVGRKRGAGMGGGHDEREQTLNQLLVEMDGFGANEGIIMIAATNRPDILDPALLRPGRFDRQIVVDLPDVRGREEILKVHSAKKPLADEVDLSRIAKVTVGYTGADLENLMNEAAIFAARRNKEKIDNQDLEDANIKVMMGTEKKSRIITDKEKKLTAYHEAGHALLTKLTNPNAKVHQVSIIPRGRAGGYTMHSPEDDKYYSSKKEMLNDIIILLGGRVAEALKLDDISTGASNDLQRATAIARSMVTQYGMSEALGPVCYDSNEEVFLGRDFGHSNNYSEKIAAQIDEEIEKILNTQYEEATKLLKENNELLEKTASLLLEKETVNEKEFEALFKPQP